jgi:hypothetical protein
MSETEIEVLPQPRMDHLVTDVATGQPRRRTEYTGTVWFGGRPQVAGPAVVTRGMGASIATPFFLPDSLPYRPDPLEDAELSCTVAVQSAEDGAVQVLEARATLVPDPRNAVVCWIQLRVVARARTPLAISYRVVASVALNAILDREAGA